MRLDGEMSDPPADQPSQQVQLPHDFDHKHSDVSGGWLRAATLGAMDGLVSNTALIAGVAVEQRAFDLLWAGLVCGGVGQLTAGALAARFTGKSMWWAGLRQLAFAAIAVATTYR